jgi:hypothetical protein
VPPLPDSGTYLIAGLEDDRIQAAFHQVCRRCQPRRAGTHDNDRHSTVHRDPFIDHHRLTFTRLYRPSSMDATIDDGR